MPPSRIDISRVGDGKERTVLALVVPHCSLARKTYACFAGQAAHRALFSTPSCAGLPPRCDRERHGWLGLERWTRWGDKHTSPSLMDNLGTTSPEQGLQYVRWRRPICAVPPQRWDMQQPQSPSYGTMGFSPRSPSAAWSTEEGVESSPKSVLIFGLSANPPTGRHGHAGIVQFLAALGKWEEIWVTPVYKHMHAKNSTLIDFEHRYNMCRLNFSSNDGKGGKGAGKQLSRIRVVRLEQEVVNFHMELAKQSGNGPVDVKIGTIDVVLYAKEMKPSTSFSLTLGTDTYNDLKNGKWKRGAELQKLVPLVVVSRPGMPYTCTDEEANDQRVSFYNVPNLSDISSTAVRQSKESRYLRKALEPKVLNYIRSHRLYAFSNSVPTSYYVKQSLRFGVLAGLVVVGFLLVWKYFRADASPAALQDGGILSSQPKP